MPTMLVLLALFVSLALLPTGPRAERAEPARIDVTISGWGCDALQYTVPAGAAPELRVRNLADESMVFAVTDFDQVVRVAPNEQVTMSLQSYVWGTFNYLCMTEAAHDAVMGPPVPNQFICGLDAYALRPRALSEGKLIIEQHDRLHELGAGRAQ